jgi:hypothetical protein
MKNFKIPVSWSLYGTVNIEAETLEEALNKFDEESDEIDLPFRNDYIDGSFEREKDIELIRIMNKKEKSL